MTTFVIVQVDIPSLLPHHGRCMHSEYQTNIVAIVLELAYCVSVFEKSRSVLPFVSTNGTLPSATITIDRKWIMVIPASNEVTTRARFDTCLFKQHAYKRMKPTFDYFPHTGIHQPRKAIFQKARLLQHAIRRFLN
jgi:hypothetical protein